MENYSGKKKTKCTSIAKWWGWIKKKLKQFLQKVILIQWMMQYNKCLLYIINNNAMQTKYILTHFIHFILLLYDTTYKK